MIHDKFTELKVSRQVKYQLRRKAEGNCPECGGDASHRWTMCRPCLDRYNRNYKKKGGGNR